MKKLLLTFLFLIIFIPSFIFVGCSNQNKGINLSTYFEKNIIFTVYGKKEDNKATLKDFTHNSHKDMAQYDCITLTGKPEWLYKMTLKTINFEIYSNQSTDIEFNISITNLKEGDSSSFGGDDIFTYKQGVFLKKNKTVRVSVPVNDYFESNANTTTIKIEVTDSSYFEADGVNTNLKFDILNLYIDGKHDLSKI